MGLFFILLVVSSLTSPCCGQNECGDCDKRLIFRINSNLQIFKPDVKVVVINGPNIFVKVLCKMIGLSDTHEREGIPIPLHDLITSHIGRRSFATNNYSKMPLVDLAVFTGHKTIGELENYIKVSELEVLSQHASKLK